MTRSNNPFIVGLFSSVSGYIFALPRGELGLYMVHVIAGFLAFFALNIVCRSIFGTVYPGPAAEPPSADEHVAHDREYPVGDGTPPRPRESHASLTCAKPIESRASGAHG